VRLIHLADFAAPYAGSFIPMIRAALTGARREGWESELVLPEAARGRPWLRALEDDRIPVRFLPAGSKAQAHTGIGSLLAESSDATILHSHFASFDVPMARAARGRPLTTLYWHVHSQLSSDPLVRLRNTARFLAYGPRVRGILCVAPHLVDEVRSRLAPRGRVRSFPNAIDTSAYPLATPQERAAARERLGLSPRARVVLHFGWDWYLKGGDLLLGAARRLNGRDDVVFLTVGGGDVAAAAIAASGLGDRVRLLEPVESAGSLYAAADVLLSPSRTEGMPFSMIESLACGTAVVASAVPGQLYVGRDLAACRFTGLDADEVVAGITGMLARDAATVEADARAARDRIVTSMDIELWAERLIALYRRSAIA